MKEKHKTLPTTIYELGEFALRLTDGMREKIGTAEAACLGIEIAEAAANVAKEKKEEEKEVIKLTQAQYDDQNLQLTATEYGMTLNQANGLLQLANTINESQDFKGSGLVCVPFWFQKQYDNMRIDLEKAIAAQDLLIKTFEKVKARASRTGLKIDDLLEFRSNILTGNSEPYIAGVTGPRVGDEHLDPDNIFNYTPKGKGGA